MHAADTARGRHIGRSVERIEDLSLLTGRGAFADDLGVKPGTLYAAIVRSPFAHARVVAIETAGALALKGVRAVLMRDEVRQWSAPFIVGVKQPMEHWSLAMERVRYVGEPVAVVIAESRYVAEDGVDLVRVEYEPIAPAVGIQQAIDPAAPILHENVGSNVVSDRRFVYGQPQAAFLAAQRVVTLTIDYPRNSCTPIEGIVVVAEHLAGDDGYGVMSNFMGPFSLHTVMALALKVPGTRLRLRAARDSGGSFGVKQAALPYIVLLCLAARKAGTPVKWVEDRLEHLTAATAATGRLTTISAAVDTSGKIQALNYDQCDDCGAYLRAPEPATFYRMHGCLTGAYQIEHLEVRNRVVLTNKTPSGLVRGFGGPQVYFALERLMQRIAVELQLDPLDVIRRNLVPATAFPHRAAAGAVFDSGDYQAVIRKVTAALPALVVRRETRRAAGSLYGIGMAAIVEPSISNMGYITTAQPADVRAKAGPKNGGITCATVTIDPLGGVSVVVASTPAGQGHLTVLAQVVADVFGLQPQDIAVQADLDTHKDAWSVAAGSYSSRFAGAVAGTAHLAALKLKDKLARAAADQLHCAVTDVVFEGGRLSCVSKPDEGLSFQRVASAFHWAPATIPSSLSVGLRETVFWTPDTLSAPDAQDHINTSAAYGFVFDLCAVEIDRNTGRVTIDRYITGHDAGTLLNPALADGQIRGGFAQGVGAALLEEFRYGEDGSFLSGTFVDYLPPTAMEIPDPEIIHHETPSPFTPLGAKGLGEGNNMSTPVAIANAVADALGVKDIRLPLTPERVMDLIGYDDPAPTATASVPLVRHARTLSGTGELRLCATPEQVFALLLRQDTLLRLIPGCEALQRVGDNQFRAQVTLGLGLVRLHYDARFGFENIVPPNPLTLTGRGVGPLGTANGSARIRLVSSDGGCVLHYEYTSQVSGKIASVGGRMLDGAVKVVLAHMFLQLRALVGDTGNGHRSWWSRAKNWWRW